ncbi:MAG: Asp-tRNA(Asn)/Glu-tRNA(Gln) amidotransferase subunit GatA [Gammaproteobacteria bacterium]|jgi:aspartyl-tRNA(Asn)/glutamyl-tRNA(Gln) amidotransferase subunit A|nr:Asp-tRNA(Asn)/Glu-tRNA(Gln) amidotransferase subunit GatA [Gammaproteobacteria bacterium]MBT3489215.1 Asp-tRNA(Asn)/Glu-tRNA(Gln) amidotransferase subunit GatA [Gammaproteobacteria bacterium]MBT3719531.1 Asp-tRNA(Asn)/Glu-tRNA(Gln) amidotransferase subunit GatA [Gammaproteobacteria bacterium]MBT3845386.1 Asp-tRNA(Asn)/Glu-tRNA(Gln) amidotransferase subunit GatA [Gammaproteobacteria bacterium]MBT3892476.1 Asp-tRNA(Asn)/Glu-tRNA(Gln) amidotransferase subunit GatA [Gammaproteobacteria bacterium
MKEKTLAELSALIAQKEISSVELTQYYLDRIERLDGGLNSFISVTQEVALKQAAAADQKIAAGTAGPLTGLPMAHKDIFCTQGVRTSCGSKMLDNFIAPYNATVVEQVSNAGMVMLGKTNMDEFAMGSSNETSYYGAVSNPWDTDYVPGGSSGGSAAAVAARLTPIATGTDTGGSIRQPAALCGITGLKPTYGRVSRWGMIAFASSLDQGGPMAQSAEDAALLLNEMAGFDPKDSTSIERDVPDYSANLNDSLKGVKIGIPREYFSEGLEGGVENVVQDAITEYRKMGAEVIDIDLPNTNLAVPTYYVVAPAECSSNLSRYDGVRYGHRCDDPKDLEDLYKRSRGEGFGDEVKRRIMIGAYTLSAGYYDAYYLKAQRLRRLISEDFSNAFSKVDVIMGPVTPNTAFRKGEKADDPVSMYLSDIYTIAVNLAGLPGMSIPAGFSDNMPVGLQLIGNHFDESKLLNLAHQYQSVTDWHRQAPAGIE